VRFRFLAVDGHDFRSSQRFEFLPHRELLKKPSCRQNDRLTGRLVAISRCAAFQAGRQFSPPAKRRIIGGPANKFVSTGGCDEITSVCWSTWHCCDCLLDGKPVRDGKQVWEIGYRHTIALPLSPHRVVVTGRAGSPQPRPLQSESRKILPQSIRVVGRSFSCA